MHCIMGKKRKGKGKVMRLRRIAVLGGGPGGLYFGYLWKRRHPEDQVDVFEQNPEGATWGFGVVFSDKALDFLRADDSETAEAITARMETWRDIALIHRGERVVLDGVGFSAVEYDTFTPMDEGDVAPCLHPRCEDRKGTRLN